MPKTSNKRKQILALNKDCSHYKTWGDSINTPKTIWSRRLRNYARSMFTHVRFDEDEVYYRSKNTRRLKAIADSYARSIGGNEEQLKYFDERRKIRKKAKSKKEFFEMLNER